MAKGSHATWGAYDSRICIVCGKPIRITTEAAWIHHDDQTGEHRSAHAVCGSPLRTEDAMPTIEGPSTPKPKPEPTDDPKPDPNPQPDA